jgi:hypothetical protein
MFEDYLDLMVQIDKFVSNSELTHGNTIMELIDALAEANNED